MDLVSRNRLIGAGIWLGLLLLIVPSWYSKPVNFSPEGEHKQVNRSTLPVVEHAYRLPVDGESPMANRQLKQGQTEREGSAPTNSSELHNQKVLTQEQKIKNALIKTDVYSSNEKYQGQWILRLRAFSDVKNAQELFNELKKNHDVYVKYFEKSKMYSVRTGPYLSEAQANKDKTRLDKMLHTQSEVVQLP